MTAALPAPCDTAVATPPRTEPSSNTRLTLAATILGSSMAFIDGSVVNVALPALARDLGAKPAELSWTINAYLLPLGSLVLLGGGAGDHFGRRRLFLGGIAIFALASLACAAAPDAGFLLAGRAAQGLGAALMMPNSLAILGATFAGEARGRAIGTWAAAGALFGAVGPLIGGWLVDTIGWRAIFLLNLPIAAAASALAWRYVAESRDTHRARLDWGGAALATAALALLTWALTEASQPTAAMTLSWLAASAGTLLLIGFVWLEARLGARALMPLAMFATRAFVGLTALTFFLYGALGGLLVLLPFRLIRIEGWPAVLAGAAVLPLPLLVGLGSPVMGRVAGRVGGRLPLAIGSFLVAAGLALYARIGLGPVGYWTDVFPGTVLVGLGLGISVAPLTTTVMASVDSDHVGAASGFNSAVARIAGLVATALLGFAFAAQGDPAAFVAAFRLAALVGMASAVLATACALILIRPAAHGS